MTEKTLKIKNPETVRLARRLAAVEGRSITEAVTEALRERLERLERQAQQTATREAVARIREVVAALPVLDPRTPDEILGYDEFGLPT